MPRRPAAPWCAPWTISPLPYARRAPCPCSALLADPGRLAAWAPARASGPFLTSSRKPRRGAARRSAQAGASRQPAQVADAAELCRNTHPARAWAAAAVAAAVRLHRRIAELNADDALYSALLRARRQGGGTMTPEERRVAVRTPPPAAQPVHGGARRAAAHFLRLPAAGAAPTVATACLPRPPVLYAAPLLNCF